MKRLFYMLPFFLLFSCENNVDDKPTTSENDIDAARNFIRSALDGDYSKAKDYMLQDSLNNQLLSTFEDNYRHRMSNADKRGYREASIRVPDVRKINDSVSVVIYSNSFKNKPDSLKVVKLTDKWVVDFKYSFPANDTTTK